MTNWKDWIPIVQIILIPVFLLILDSRIATALAAHNRDTDAHPSSKDIAKLELKFETAIAKFEVKVDEVRRAVENSSSVRDISIADLRLAIEKITPRRRMDDTGT